MFYVNIAPRTGFEPVTCRLTAGCSTAELPRNVYTLTYTLYKLVQLYRILLLLQPINHSQSLN